MSKQRSGTHVAVRACAIDPTTVAFTCSTRSRGSRRESRGAE
jgi:hypothetical protein